MLAGPASAFAASVPTYGMAQPSYHPHSYMNGGGYFGAAAAAAATSADASGAAMNNDGVDEAEYAHHDGYYGDAAFL